MEPQERTAWPAWATEEVRLVAADPAWAEHANRLAAELRQLLHGWLRGPVVHVGSTAVAGLVAKPVIDLQAIAGDPATTVVARNDALAGASWFVVPRELDQRPWRWFIVRTDTSGRHRLAHLHLMRPGEPRWHQQIAFRDALRADPALAREYADLKTEAARDHPHDRETYTEAKHAFIRGVLDRDR
ncbi:GrpB family protein [Halostreptopolyspora alba]|uniref:GrpB family protein n=1 Tax=Halostreptopolyspora alba TaxID=2487137 RepID=A0A3N0EGK7_9ACTN|nr:GrpB family protein [Nocardiopsaceae bacterium YIM 96095]